MKKIISRRQFLSASAVAILNIPALQNLPRGQAQADVDPFALREYRNKKGESLAYRLFTPLNYNKEKQYPLTIWLHGSGGDKKIYDKYSSKAAVGNQIGLWRLLALPENQALHQSFVFVPRCPPEKRWDDLRSSHLSGTMRLVLEVLGVLQIEFNIDGKRLSIIGASLGGYGVWDVIAKRTEMFAAAIPICGGGDTNKAASIAKTPVWAFHGERDAAVSVEESRKMIAAIKRAGGNPKYTEYKGVGHNSWDRACAEPELLPWISRQKRA